MRQYTYNISKDSQAIGYERILRSQRTQVVDSGKFGNEQ
jgi:hypothetical protein